MNISEDAYPTKFTGFTTQSIWWHLHSFGILFLFIVISYSNTLSTDWHLDDFPNIIENEKLHLTSFNLDSINQVFFAHPREEGRLFRPVAYLSFALNWYLGADNVFGYHLVNILFHWGTAVLLYLVVLQLLETPVLQKRSISTKHQAALLTALLWAMNPVQTQAVTYIVQRMAVLATLFFLAAFLCYLMGRRDRPRMKQFYWFLAGLVCFVLSLGSKENVITLPAVLVLVEGFFFQSFSKIKKQHILLGAGLLFICGVAAYLLTNGNPLGSIFNYEHRSFTLWQRVLTESRIMVFYLSLLFFPAPFRLSLDHDVILSTSLFQPLTTIFSITFLVVLTLWALWKHKTWPITSFAILFFLLNHVIESSVFPLELIFEHRNYLPSLFLFLPIAVLLVDAYNGERLQTAPVLRHTLAGAVLLTLCALSVATYTRNNVWRTEQSLWEDGVAKAPGQSRPYINLAVTYQKLGRNDEAFELSRQSLSKNSPTPTKDRMRAYNNMGNIAAGKGNYKEAIGYYQQALQANENESSHYYLYKTLLADRQFDAAKKELEGLMQKNPNDGHLMTNMGVVLALEGQYPQAIAMLHATLDTADKKSFAHIRTVATLGSILSRNGDYQGAEQQFKTLFSISEPRLPLLCVIGNHLRQNNREAAKAQLKELYKHFRSEDLLSTVTSAASQEILFPVDTQELIDFIRSTSDPGQTPDDRKL
ncbi:tetratricopeptide repeat protein [Desulfoprunum benzoelyticum]|uniref:Tetratricopeptide (TPR) repeat protein n=1 Tax=Desulfoprunum benzoelyticum TaxID=1506996 RepID=A0A840UYE3_9BACT|nr:tetratricopeptide repeat protein [Desulfoprunum benzoelyticum]MBB5347678.1 tetratricopeptide (TPR) repeat protein [Desulfoprunum benzoelyticum]MBM9529273.1 tetratricopeptide repeat protein [Desulfoprunum benzoelyticum]